MMHEKRGAVDSVISRRTKAATGAVVLLVATIAGSVSAADRPRRLPKGVEAVRLPDGSHDVTAKVTTPLPTGEQVKRLSPGDRLEEAARILCPQGHDIAMRDGAKSRIVSGRFVATQSANVRCTIGTNATTSPAVHTP